MRWYHYVAYFSAGLLLTNVVPHLVSGVQGYPFPSPFATPPGEGLSSPTVNVVWSFANLVGAYLLVGRVGRFDARDNRHLMMVLSGILASALMLAQHFGALHAVASRP